MKDENKIPPHEKLTDQQLEDYLKNLVDTLTGENRHRNIFSWFDPEKVNITKPFVKNVKVEHEPISFKDWVDSYEKKPNGWESGILKKTKAEEKVAVLKRTDEEFKEKLTKKFTEAGKKSTNTQEYYKGKDSLYKFSEEWGLNTYEFDILKRVVRCRHKGHFREDLQKTKELIEIYLAEWK